MKTLRLFSRVSLAFLISFLLLIGPAELAARAHRGGRAAPARKPAAASKAATSKAATKPAHKKQAAAKPAQKKAGQSTSSAAKSTAAKRDFALSSSGLQRKMLLSDPVMSQLQAIARPYVEAPTPTREQELRLFAADHPRHAAGALAYLALGYTAIEGKRFAAAESYLAAGRRIDSPLADYFDYYLAQTLQEGGRHKDAAELLNGFEERYPQSSLVGRAVIARARAWVATGRAPEAAALLASRLGALRRPDADIELGRAYAAQGRYPEAVEAYRQIYYLYPASSEADDAEREIRRLSSQAAVSPPAIELRKERAGRLFQARQYTAAESAYADVAANSSGAERERATVERAACLFRANRTDRAYSLLRGLQLSDPEAEGKRLYWQGQSERRMSRDADFLKTLQEMGERAATSSWYEEALFSAANSYLLDRNFEESARLYRTLYEHFPNGKYAAMAHWRVAWKYYRTGDSESARRQLEEHVLSYPQSPQLSAALYWLGRIAEEAGSKPVALAYYRKLSSTFSQYFYGIHVREKLSGAQVVPASSAALPEQVQRVLASVRAIRPPLAVDPPADLPEHRRKVEALETAGLLDLAIVELRHVTSDPAHTQYLLLELARLEHDRGRFPAAIVDIRTVYPNYFAYAFDDLSQETWQLLFPLPWWPEIQFQALRYGLDPYLVAALIRQESAFNSLAVSSAKAYGLMQLLPSTGRNMAGVRRLSADSLLDPIRNLELGTKYLRQVIDRYSGNLEAALASYNAGPDRVDLWLRQDKVREPAEFIENIPFTETHDYVQALLRNTAVYRRLYGPTLPSGSAAAGATRIRATPPGAVKSFRKRGN